MRRDPAKRHPSSKERDFPYPVDFVITWVDGQDPAWRRKRAAAANSQEHERQANDNCRFINSNELLYALRSIYTNCSWFNKIYIVTDNQRPIWLNEDCEEVVVVDHKTIFGKEGKLPTFNSNAIESRLHHIPGLAEHYVTLNDDFFIGRGISEKFFFHDRGEPRLYFSALKKEEKILREMLPENLERGEIYQRTQNRTRKLIWKEYGLVIRQNPRHTPKPFRKSAVLAVEKRFWNQIEPTLHHQFRSAQGLFFLALCMFDEFAAGNRPIPAKLWSFRRDGSCLSYRDYIHINLGKSAMVSRIRYWCIRAFSPACICLNDVEKTTPENREEMVRFLAKLFPNKCPAERGQSRHRPAVG